MTFQTKIILSFLGLTVACGTVSLWLFQNPVGAMITESTAHGGLSAATKLAKEAVPGFQSMHERDLLPILQSAEHDTGALFAMALDPSGLVLAHTNVSEKGTLCRDAEAVDMMRSGQPEVRVHRMGRELIMDVSAPVWAPLDEDPSERFLFKVQAGAVHQRRLGTVRLGLPLHRTQASKTKLFRQMSAIGLSVGLIAILFAFWLMRSFLKPVELLVQGTQRIAQGDYGVSVPIEAGDELGQLAKSFNSMSKILAETTVSKDFFSSVLASMLDPLLVMDPDGRLQMINPAACRFLGYAEQELIGKPVHFLFDEADALAAATEPSQDGAAGLPQANRELHFLTKGGIRVPILFSRSVLKDHGGHVTGMIGVAKDLSERKAAEERLAHSNRELQDFASIASHDLQEPLRKVQVFGDRLKMKCAEQLGDEGRDYLQRMQNAVARMQSFINDLLAYSRVTTKAKPFEPVDLGKIAEEVMSDLEIRIEQTGAKVDIGPMPSLEADPLQMRQLLQNLIANALKFHRPDASPHVRVEAESVPGALDPAGRGPVCRIYVRDNGIGFEQKHADRIFKIFERLHGREEYEGTGIGLAVCRKIVDRHEGRITAEGVPNQGATFIVELPMAHQEKA
jgi:PAS domain S-box-containing protein